MIAVLDGDEVLLHQRFPTTRAGFAALMRAVAGWPDRWWAVEGAGGKGHHLARRLVAAGEVVVDVPAKLATRCGSAPAANGGERGTGARQSSSRARATASGGRRS